MSQTLKQNSNECKVFPYCDLLSHEDMSTCCNRMDSYYGAMVGGSEILFCGKCLYISHGAEKRVFYRDHGDHLEELTIADKMLGIMRGIYFIYFSIFILH